MYDFKVLKFLLWQEDVASFFTTVHPPPSHIHISVQVMSVYLSGSKLYRFKLLSFIILCPIILGFNPPSLNLLIIELLFLIMQKILRTGLVLREMTTPCY